MVTTRQSILRGPGSLTFSGSTFFDKDGINANLETASSDVGSSISGKLDTIKSDQSARITLTPVGNVSQAILNILFPSWLQTPVIGQSVFGSTDAPLVVHSKAGTKITFHAAALTNPPDLTLSPVQTAFGSVEFTALVANGKLPSDANALYKVESAAYALGNPPRTGLTGSHYSATWGSLSIPDTQNGWTVSIEPQLEAVTTDSQGTIDYTLGGVNVTARCTPLGLTESQILSALNATAARGSSLAGSSDLVISGALNVTLKNAALTAGPLQWGTTTLRAGEIALSANIAPSSGALFSVSIPSAS